MMVDQAVPNDVDIEADLDEVGEVGEEAALLQGMTLVTIMKSINNDNNSKAHQVMGPYCSKHTERERMRERDR